MNKKIFDFINESYFNQRHTVIFEHFLKPQLIKVEEGKSEISMNVETGHLNLHQKVHGGILATLADMAMGIACLSFYKSIVTSEMHVSYIRNVTAGKIIKAIGSVDNNGNNLMRTSCELFDENDKLLLKAMGTYFVVGELKLDK